MKKYILSTLVALATLFAVSSCSENEPTDYVGGSALYIDNEDVNFSFFYTQDASDRASVKIKVHAQGLPSSEDRAFTLYQKNVGEVDAAQAGKHYLAFDSEEMKQAMVMPAGKNEVEVPIVLLKDASLDTKVVKLKIGVKPNENFAAGVIEKDSVVVSFSSQAIKPTNWADWKNAFGSSWGSVKMRFIIDNTGITNFDTVPDDYSYMEYLKNKLNSRLFDYNAAHPDAPLAEADGTLVDFD